MNFYILAEGELRDELVRRLTGWGHAVIYGTGPKKAAATISVKPGRWHAVIADEKLLQHPREVWDSITNEQPGPRVIMVVLDGSNTKAVHLDAGAHDVLIFPFSADDLMAALS